MLGWEYIPSRGFAHANADRRISGQSCAEWRGLPSQRFDARFHGYATLARTDGIDLAQMLRFVRRPGRSKAILHELVRQQGAIEFPLGGRDLSLSQEAVTDCHVGGDFGKSFRVVISIGRG